MSFLQDVADPPTVDARAPRFNQAIIGTASLAAYLLDFWPLLGLAALQLGLTLTFGPRLCLGCLIYFKLVRPRLGPAPVKDARPVRFANHLQGHGWHRSSRVGRQACPGPGGAVHLPALHGLPGAGESPAQPRRTAGLGRYRAAAGGVRT